MRGAIRLEAPKPASRLDRGLASRHESGRPQAARSSSMKLLTELFAWWTGNTIGTSPFTWRYGTRVRRGRLRQRLLPDQGREAALGDLPRPVRSLAGAAGMARLAALHRGRAANRRSLQGSSPGSNAYEPNLTGTPEAYRPPGSILNPDAGKAIPRDYEPWQPGPSE